MLCVFFMRSLSPKNLITQESLSCEKRKFTVLTKGSKIEMHFEGGWNKAGAILCPAVRIRTEKTKDKEIGRSQNIVANMGEYSSLASSKQQYIDEISIIHLTVYNILCYKDIVIDSLCALRENRGRVIALGAAGSRIAHVVWFVRFPAKGLLCPFVGIFMWFSFDLDYELGLQKAVPIQHNAFAVTMEKLQVDRLTRFW